MYGILIDPLKEEVSAVVTHSLKDWYKLMNCDIVTTTYRRVGGRMICIIADDEGLLKESASVSGIDSHGAPVLVGSLIAMSMPDDEGNTAEMSADDVFAVMNGLVRYELGGRRYTALAGLE